MYLVAKGDKVKECFQWLWDNKVKPLTDHLLYEEKDGEIIAVAGVIHCIGDKSKYIQIEPMISRDARASNKLYDDIMEYARENNFKYVLAGSANPLVHKHLEKRGWQKWDYDVTQYIKEL